MKKFYSLLLALCLFTMAKAQNITFPDANFKAKLITLAIDTNSDGEISRTEAQNVTGLNLSSSNITDLTGIEYFTGLNSLTSSGNNLSTVNFSLINLMDFTIQSNLNSTLVIIGAPMYVTVSNVGLTSLTILNSPRITELDCRGNQLTNLQIVNSSNIRSLNCSNNPNLTFSDFSNFHSLIFADISGNTLVESIFIKTGNDSNCHFSYNPNLRYICCDESKIGYYQQIVDMMQPMRVSINSYCSFVPGGDYYTMQGNVKYDSNNNGNCETSDANFHNLKFSITNGTTSGIMIANAAGDYHIPVQAGTHTVTPVLENPNYFTISPSSTSVTFPTQVSPFIQNFCVAANGVNQDLEVVLLPTNPARPGFNSSYALTFKNKGNQVHSGSIALTFEDSKMDFIAATPNADSQVLNNLIWNYTNLQPFETRVIYLTIHLNAPTDTPAVNGGDQLNFSAVISPISGDEIPYDNTFGLKQTVVNSFDPNDKTCLEGPTISPSEVGKYAHYMIRFENTGTFPAENIVVKDMIDTNKFDINSLVRIKGSHSFVTNITSGNEVQFIFENINLPFDDANNDGYVAFKIKTKPNLVVGNTFSNSASIYFDYNFPIVTNTATTAIQVLSNQDFGFSQYFSLYPNPVKDVLNIETKQTIEVSSINIYNQLGQLVLVVPNAQNVSKVDVSSLASGNYFIKINSDKGTSNTKFIKQ